MLWSTNTTVRPCGDGADERDRALDVFDAHAGGRFIEQQELRIERERESEFDGTLLAVGEVTDDAIRVVGHSDLVEQLHRAVRELGEALVGTPEAIADSGRASEGEFEVLACGELFEETRDLERPSDSEVGDVFGLFAGDVVAFEAGSCRSWASGTRRAG